MIHREETLLRALSKSLFSIIHIICLKRELSYILNVLFAPFQKIEMAHGNTSCLIGLWRIERDTEKRVHFWLVPVLNVPPDQM